MTSSNPSENDILFAGLVFMGWNKTKFDKNSEKSKNDNWKACYAPSPYICSLVFHEINLLDGKVKVIDFMMAIFWLTKYPTIPFICQIANLSEKTCTARIKKYIDLISQLRDKKIKWTINDNPNENFVMTVDGTHCPISEPRTQPSADWYSHKFHGPGLGYEIGLSIFKNQVIWLNGPVKAGEPDMNIFRLPGGLKEKIPVGKRVIADKGYRGENEIISTPNDFDPPVLKGFKKRARARHETFNGRIKRFAILTERFRHRTNDDLKYHKKVFEACVIICQFEIESRHPLFEV